MFNDKIRKTKKQQKNAIALKKFYRYKKSCPGTMKEKESVLFYQKS